MRGAGTRLVLASTLAVMAGCTHGLDMVGCEELLVEFPVDAEAARRAVPSGLALHQPEPGRAMLLLLVQECDQGLFDRVLRVRPLRMSQVWIELAGRQDSIPPLPGTVRSLPTMRYYAAPHQTDSLLAHLAFTAAGIDSQKVDAITAGGPAGRQRAGEVAEGGAAGGYRWTDGTRLRAEPEVVTGHREFIREFGSILARRSRGEVTCRAVFKGEGEVALDATPASAVGRLGLGDHLAGRASLVRMDCRASIELRRR
jgi:hypothetical protein